MRRRRLGVAACAVALTLVAAVSAGCGSDDDEGSDPQRFTDLSEPIEVEDGDIFEIVLDANPTTGYHWEVSSSTSGDAVILEGSDYEPDDDSGELAGGGGKETFTFRAENPGEMTFDFEYLPPGRPVDRGTVETESAKISVR